MELDYRQNAMRTNVALRRARIAIREGNAPTVRNAREAIVYLAGLCERYGREELGAAVEAFRLAHYATSRKGV